MQYENDKTSLIQLIVDVATVAGIFFVAVAVLCL